MSPSPSAFKYAVAQALAARARIRQLAVHQGPRCFSAPGGFVVLAGHTFRAGAWRVYYLDAHQEPVVSVDAANYAEGLYLALLAGADLGSPVVPLAAVEKPHAQAV